MSSVLEPGFLLELGAYAVAFAGIRLFRNRYFRTSGQGTAEQASRDEQRPATPQGAPPTVVGLGQASPLRALPGRLRSLSPQPQLQSQPASPVAYQPLRAEDIVSPPIPTCYCPLLVHVITDAAPATTALGVLQACCDHEVGQQASALPPNGLLQENEFQMDISAQAAPAQNLQFCQSQPSNANGHTAEYEGAVDTLTPTDHGVHVRGPCGQFSYSNVVDDPLDHDSVPETEVCEQTSLHTVAVSDDSDLLQMEEEEQGLESKPVAPPAIYDIEAMDVEERSQPEEEQMAAGQLGEDEEEQMQQEELAHGPPSNSDPMEEEECPRGILECPAHIPLWGLGEEKHTDCVAAGMADNGTKSEVSVTRADAAAPDIRASATRGDEHFGVLPKLTTHTDVQPLSSVAQDLPSATAVLEHARPSAAESLPEPLEDSATFKVVYVSDAPTVKINGADLEAWAQAQRGAEANPNTDLEAENSSQESPDVQLCEEAEEAADAADIDIMCESCDEDEQHLTDVSKAVGQDDWWHGSEASASSSKAAQVDRSSSQLLVSDSGRGDESGPEEAEKAVVTNRDILLRAVQKRKRVVGDSSFYIDPSLEYMVDSNKARRCGEAKVVEETGPKCPAPNKALLAESAHMPGKEVAAETEASLSEPTAPATHAMPAELLKEIVSATRQLLAGSTEGAVPEKVDQPEPSRSNQTLASQLQYGGGMHSREAKLASAAEHAAFSRDLKLACRLPMAGQTADPSQAEQALDEQIIGTKPDSPECELQEEEAEEQYFGGTASALKPQHISATAGSMCDGAPMSEAEEEQPRPVLQAMTAGYGPEEVGECGQPQLPMPGQAASAGEISQPPADTPAAVLGDDAEEEEQVCMQRGLAQPDHSPYVMVAAEEAEECCQAPVEQPNQASCCDVRDESADQPALSSRSWLRLRQKSAKGQLSTRRSRAGSYEVDHCHESDYLSHELHSSSHPAPFPVDSAQPQDEMNEGRYRGQLGVRYGDHRKWCTWEEEDSSPPAHESPDDSSWRDTICVADSAPPITPDSPARSAVPPNSPSWCSSREATPNGPGYQSPALRSHDPWESPPRAAPHSPRQSAWDSPPRPSSHSPAICHPTGVCSLPWLPLPPRAVSRYGRCAHDSSPAPSIPDQDPYCGGVVGGLDGDYAYGSYHSPPPQEIPHSPDEPPNSPPRSPHGTPWLHHMAHVGDAHMGEAGSPFHGALAPAGPEYPCSGGVMGGRGRSHAFGNTGFSPAASSPRSPSQPPHSPSRSPPRRHAYPVYPGRRDLACRLPAINRHDSSDLGSPPNPFEPPFTAAFKSSMDFEQAEEVEDAQQHSFRPPLQPSEIPMAAAAAKPGQGDSPAQAEEEGATAVVPASFDFQDHKRPLNCDEKAEMCDVASTIIKAFEHFQAKQAQQEAERDCCHGESSPVCEAEEGHEQPDDSQPASLQEGEEGQQLSEEEQHWPEVEPEAEEDFKHDGPKLTAPSSPHRSLPLYSPPNLLRGCLHRLPEFLSSRPYFPSREGAIEGSSKTGDHCTSRSAFTAWKRDAQEYGTPQVTDEEEWQAGEELRQGQERAETGANKKDEVDYENVDVLEQSSPASAGESSPEPLDPRQAGEEAELGNDSSASKEDRAEPEMMGMDEEEAADDDDDVEFVSETGPDPAKSAFACAMKRLDAAKARLSTQDHILSDGYGDGEDIELYPGVQRLISNALDSKQDRHSKHSRRSRHSMADPGEGMAGDESRGRSLIGRLPWKRKRHSHASPGARGSSPSKHGKHSSHSKHHGHHRHHRDRRDHTDNTSKDEDDWLNPGRLSASVSAAGSCQQAGAAAAAAAGAGAMSIARRARDLLGVTEEEEEEEQVKQEDLTCWRKLLKKSRHH